MSDPTSNDAFNSKSPVTPENKSAEDQLISMLMNIKNEKGEPKYDSVPKALEALQHSQKYIPELKTEIQKRDEELAKIKAELEKRASVEDVVGRLMGGKDDGEDKAGTPPGVAQLDSASVEKLVEQVLNKNKQQESAKSNRQKVVGELAQLYGDKVSDVIAEKARELGTTAEQLGTLASQNPNLVLALFKGKVAAGTKPTTGSVNIPPYNTKQPELEKPAKSLLSGASTKDQVEYMRKIRESVYKKHGIES